MSTERLIGLLNNLLPDNRILKDVNQILNQEIERGYFSESEPEKIPPKDVTSEVVDKRFILLRYEAGFGNRYVSRVAVGGVLKHRSGVIIPRYFFATAYYTDDLHLITVDFHDEFDE